MLIKLPKTRQFTYRPRFYEPPVEEDEGGPRVKFRRYRRSNSTTKRPLLLMILLVVVLIFLLFHWFAVYFPCLTALLINLLEIKSICYLPAASFKTASVSLAHSFQLNFFTCSKPFFIIPWRFDSL